MTISLVRRKILIFGLLIVFVFFIFQIVSAISPTLLRFSARSALTALKFSLPDSVSLLDKFQVEPVSADKKIVNSSNDEEYVFDSNESALFSEQNSSILNFQPPFLVGPERVDFSSKDLSQFNEKDGPIFRNCYYAGKSNKVVKIGNSAFVKNLTSLPNSVIEQANKNKPSFNLVAPVEIKNAKNKKDNEKPQVLILHTHATEAYELQEKSYYSNKKSSHSRDFKITVVSVGEEIVKQLKSANIEVIHDKTIHDSPSYFGAYNRSNDTIRKYLAKYPSIKVVLDVHRDAIQNEKAQRFAPVVKIDGRKAAQVMIIAGCDNGNKTFPNYEQNLAFACFLQRHLDEKYPKLARPMLFKYKHYNQSLTPGTLLVEIGSNSNSVDEAMYSGWLFGKAVAAALRTLMK